MKRITMFGLVFVVALPVMASAAVKTFKMAAFQVPLLIEDSTHGVFVELFWEIVQRAGEQFELAVYPVARARKMFTEGEADGLFPTLEQSLEYQYVKSLPFYSKDEVVFVRAGTPLIEDLAGLEGKVVGLTKGYTYGAGITENPNMTIEWADSDLLNVRKLSKGRLDAFVVEKQSGLQAQKESAVTNVVYNAAKPLSARPVFFAFQDTEEGRMLAEKFSKALTAMKADGSFDEIMKKAQ